MSQPFQIVVFAGSIRTGSYNAMVASAVVPLLARFGAEAVPVDLADYPAPLYNADIEAESGLPESVVALKRVFQHSSGFIAVSPEYNGSVSPLMKNTIDWMSRRGEDPTPMLPFRGKVAGLLSASPGRLGGLRGLVELRRVLSGIGVLVVPQQYAVHTAGKAFGEDGSLVQDEHWRGITRVVEATVSIARRIG